nr:molecular chaperone MKKS-like [Cherax quadricarinatus]XP_053633469.1 molecular chaperone MKKS-like [Cherax quadricarinatus]XP_053633470.1 molecular chaperone MKKS-like [Cherax quadricarinatus]XP_053633471.1 molecular chaperone MKKS-like [Cherax quadricarinatus]XP_053633473.1 molecular chaperone MKKS-like [Cherax quadricarinatus]XP_053633474.1 molecular chaperone MKKS-like [Cherax quadricarinatus]XP_053633475.1 molecular chaperone MKKS-like [Cherax quadricarinatus]XP_053633476.1 molecular 
MSSVRLDEERVRGIYCHSVQDLAYISMLKEYRKLLFSAYGPRGSSILISNAVGRETLAASSSEIIKELSFAHPSVKYINALISAQNAACGLNGLYTGMLCVRLLEESLICEQDIPHRVVSDVSEWIISELLELLTQSPDEVTMDLDVGDMQQVTSFVQTILGAKNCLGLNKVALDDLSLNIVKAFLKSIPNEYSSGGFGHVTVSTQERSSSINSKVFDGVLYREPDISLRKIEKLKGVGNINIVLFTVPILYVEGETISVCWRASETKEKCFINKVLLCLLSCMKRRNIHILANQKPVHPVIKFELEREGFLVLERMGTKLSEAVTKLSGCQAISNLANLTLEMNTAVLGKLNTVEHINYSGKSYILLDHAEGSVSTLLLPVTSPSTLTTLKETTESCLAALRMVVVDGKVVAGGGCLEAWAATQVSQLINTNMQHLTDLTDASPYHILKVASAFIRVFMELALQPRGGSSTRFDWSVDSVFHHLWHTQPQISREDGSGSCSMQASRASPHSCMCGLVKEDLVKYKYNGSWNPVEFQLHHDFTLQNSKSTKSGGCSKAAKSPRSAGDLNIKLNADSTQSNNSSLSDFGFHNLDLEVDSLEEAECTTEDEVDSLEKIINSQEEEIDSLEGKLDSFDAEEDMDSLEDMLDGIIEQSNINDKEHLKVKLETRVQQALYDSFPAKYNAIRLALEGFTQLFHVGQCVFDK